MSKLIYGVGVNDADYVIQPTMSGKVSKCPFYTKWTSMLTRCYRLKQLERNPTYIGCSVSEDFLVFSRFKSWMETQDWQGKDLDKDLLKEGNKIYSPKFCVFIDKSTNLFITDKRVNQGDAPAGVSYRKDIGKFRATCSNPFTKKIENLGCFTCPDEAHQAWKKRKHELACQLADLQTDKRVADVLRVRYL